MYLITGASSEVAGDFIRLIDKREHGAKIIGLYNHNKKRIDELNDECSNIDICPIQCDFSSSIGTENIIKQLSAEYEVDRIFHVAAPRFSYMRIRQYDWNRINKEISVQVNSFGIILKYFAPQMAKKREGKILAILSSCCFNAPPKFISHYVVAKYALEGLVKAAATEYSDKNILINGISPEMMETEFLDTVDSRFVEKNAMESPLKRNIRTSEVARAAYFLLSNENTCITGENLNMSGGRYM